ncbi:hypothetical protein Z517_06055 [Fonsecaea pedrosoi CBS 271.37]|uniref:Zn(2)-C6 fungal-type domain-containing protein n=1 Tax=Fonsecaea pedrosoi CBS 271.37 TaxID=1442368 RepID=A0A0D2GF63_9EURO|nr:uncharacterized protein Z517_06055 [Fonsecaea pedrosoi CBS 271.37]KIW79443.1 hypothetical protein Z517_06055 [Fonsecaea pedrosoi CBS 271.37]
MAQPSAEWSVLAPESRLNRPRNPRSAKACLSCRGRKVRCDAVSKRPEPCTNCTLDGLICELAPRRHSTRRSQGAGVPTRKTGSARVSDSDGHSVHNAYPSRRINQAREIGPPDAGALAASPANVSQTRSEDSVQPDEDIETTQITVRQPLGARVSTDMRGETSLPQVQNNTDICMLSTDDFTAESQRATLSDSYDSFLPTLDYEFSDEQILEQYMNLTDVFDPSVTAAMSVGHPLGLSPASVEPPVQHRRHVFKSPLPWVADWVMESHKDDDAYTQLVEQRVLHLPEISEISLSVQLYFTYVHHRLPLLDERDFYLLVNGTEDELSERPLTPISLALLYCIMFAACPYSKVRGMDPSQIRTLRAKRNEHYSRATFLFKLGCESDPMRRVQICLLLSTFKAYPGHFVENERWIIEAYKTIQSVGVWPQKNSTPGFAERSEWNRVCACWLHRFSSALMGLRWTSNPKMMDAISLPWHTLGLKDFERDFSFSWYLSAAVKQQLTRLFVARIEMQVLFGHLGKVLWRRTADQLELIGEKPDFTPPAPSNPMPIEEMEARYRKWRYDNTSLCELKPHESLPRFERRLLRLEQLITKLTYEYAITILYQNTLILERSLITPWARRIIESSRLALWDSIKSMMEILKEVRDEQMIFQLPSNMLIVVLIPLTIFYLYIQQATDFEPSTVESLAICSQLSKTMVDLYDATEFFPTILKNTVVLAQRYRQTSFGSCEPESLENPQLPPRPKDETCLPDYQLYSLVLRFQCLALVLGRIPRVEDFVQQEPPNRPLAII